MSGYWRKVSSIPPTSQGRGSTISRAPNRFAAMHPAPYFLSPWVRVGPSSMTRARRPRIRSGRSTEIGEAASMITASGFSCWTDDRTASMLA